MEKKKSKEEVYKDLKRQERQQMRNTKIKAIDPGKDGKETKLIPGKAYMVGAKLAAELVKLKRAEIVN